MPPRTRTRATKVLKENIEIVKKDKLKSNGKVTKLTRKALADKTNSLSDDNASIDIPIRKSNTTLKSNALTKTDNNVRPRRDRRLPPRYVENHVLKNLSNSKDMPVEHASRAIPKAETINKDTKDTKIKCKMNTPPFEDIDSIKVSAKASLKGKKRSSKFDKATKNGTRCFGIPSSTEEITTATYTIQKCHLQSEINKSVSKDSSQNVSSPFKTASKDLDCSLVADRPKRICRLPSKFEDHSISPNKFIPVQPCHASTPIIQKNVKTISKRAENLNVVGKNKIFAKNMSKDKSVDKPISTLTRKSKRTKAVAQSNSSNSSVDNSSLDTNNNGKNNTGRPKRATVNTKLQSKQVSPKTKKIMPFAQRLLEKSLPFRILDDKKQSKSKDSFDVYEFTFDPNEEPPPQKKKRKKTVKKKPAKPKMVVLKSNYNDNVSKALANLKSKIKPLQSQPVQNIVKPTDSVKSTNSVKLTTENVQSTQVIVEPVIRDNIPQLNNNYNLEASAMPPINESGKTPIHESNYASIRIEDIAADFESNDPIDDINYSPVNSPQPPFNTEAPKTNENHMNPVLNTDPLNLQGDMSFFDDHPVASSSMNVSARHPLASPWRVEFGNLPVKWHSNAYVKPNMTPAVESSFINSEDTAKKKHVYTNMVPENEPLPEIVEAPNLKQPSIISFMREVAEKSLNKKKRRRSPSPTKANSIFDDVTNTVNDIGFKTPKKAKKTSKDSTPNTSSNSNDKSNDKENSNQSSNRSVSPAKPQKKKDKDCTYFGFDDSENLDQENDLPVKNIPNSRGLRSRAVLQDFNAQVGPIRAARPVAAKAKLTSSEVVEQLHEQLKSAGDAPQFLEKDTAKELADDTVASNVNDPSWHEEEDDDSQSVHLFEDIEVVHHMKGYRKSYGKVKKVTIRQPSDSDSDTQPHPITEPVYTADEDLADPSFYLPNIKEKKTTKRKPKKQLTKKEEKEVEEWAAGFNSMCEDIDEYSLLVE